MSMKAFNWAKRQVGLTSPQKFVLIMIADHYNDAEKRSWPAIETLAEETALNPRTVTRALRELEELGLSQTENWFNERTHKRMNNHYCLPTLDDSVPHRGKVQSAGSWTVPTRQSGPPTSSAQSTGAAEFEAAWASWPKKTERKKSLEKFTHVARSRGADVLAADVIRFGNAYRSSTEVRFVPALAVWLSHERWTDDLPTRSGRDVQDGRTPKKFAPYPDRVSADKEWMYR